MLEKLIASSISNLQENHVIQYAQKEGYQLEKEEAKIITTFLKTHWKQLYYQDRSCLSILKEQISNKTYEKALILYEKAIHTYLN